MTTIDRQTIEERRALLVEQIELDKARYEQVEQMLVDLRRSLDMQYGGLRELDGLLALLALPAPAGPCELCEPGKCGDCRRRAAQPLDEERSVP